MLNSNGAVIKTENLEDTSNADSDELSPLRCWDCNVNFTSKYYLHQHLLYHVKQPIVVLTRAPPAPIKITLKSRSDNSFEIINSPTSTSSQSPNGTPIRRTLSSEDSINGENLAANDENTAENEECSAEDNVEYIPDDESFMDKEGDGTHEETTHVTYSPNYVTDEAENSSTNEEDTNKKTNMDTTVDNSSEYANIPGAEPTPPPEPSPEFPKIRIKSGLLKESSVTITEITDDNQKGGERSTGSNVSNKRGLSDYRNDSNSLWSTPSLEDPLRISDSDKEDNSLLSLFSNNNERAKDLGFTSSDSEFISLERLDERNHNALQVYSHSSSMNQNPLDSLTGLPMQQLAQQVSRLQPGSGMHQQNVLINIQQFPQAPNQPQHGYQPPPPPMYHQPPMYQHYQYQPPNHMYYPPAPAYAPPHMPPPPPPQMSQHPPQTMVQHQQQMSQQQMNQHSQQQINHHQQQMSQQSINQQQSMSQQSIPMQQSNQYGQQSMQPRTGMPRQPVPPQRPQMGSRMMAPRQPLPRQRGPVPRPRGGGMGIRGPRPRMPTTMMGNSFSQPQMNPQKMVRRSAEQIQQIQAKRKKIDILVPDKNDDPDCQVICTQPKNTDGGLPQIQSVQGGTVDPADNVMHLSDSITLSVRNPPARPESPKKSDAKDVANILATRGITVTATAKPKEKVSEPPKKNTPSPPPVAINLNSAVSIIPTAKQNNSSTNGGSNGNNKAPAAASEHRLPTVDLTDEAPEPSHQPVPQSKPSPPPPPPLAPQKPNQRGALPYRCDLCPAQYPNAAGLNKHRQMYHKTGGPCEIGVPLINLKQAGVLQKLSSLGIYNYIPLPGANPDGTFAIPVINARNPGNINGLGATSVLTLGPVRSIPRPQVNANNHINNNSK